MSQSFKTHKDALAEFSNLSVPKLRVKGNQSGVIVPQKKEISGAYLDEFRSWIAACQNLSTPWSAADLMALSSAGRARNDDGSMSRRTEVLALMETPFAAHQDILETFLQWGMNPTAFIKRAHVTLLGYAAYAQRLDDVKLLLRYCTPPSSRLLLESKMLPRGTANRDSMVNSTLLHRMASRFSKDCQKILPIVDAILEHDPAAIMCKTKNGSLPEHGATGPLRQEMKDRRLAYQALMSKTELLTHVEVDRAAVGVARKM